MVKGEQDYTQRVLATIRPTGIAGGHLLFHEDFESYGTHYPAAAGTFGITSTPGEVFEGVGSGKFILAAGGYASTQFTFPMSEAAIVAVELLFKPEYANLQTLLLALDIVDGTYRHRPQARIYTDQSKVYLQVADDTPAYVTAKSFSSVSIPALWNMFRFEVDLAAGVYRAIQLSMYRTALQTQAYQRTSSLAFPYGLLTLAATNGSWTGGNVFIDDIYVTYEEPS